MNLGRKRQPEPAQASAQPSTRPSSSRFAAGSVYEGLLTYTTDPEIGRPGYYALEDDGQTLRDPLVMLSHIDDAPGDDEDGAGHFIIADPDQPYFAQVPAHLAEDKVIPLESRVKGQGGVSSDV